MTSEGEEVVVYGGDVKVELKGRCVLKPVWVGGGEGRI